MLKAGLLERPKKGWLRITARGIEALRSAEPISSKSLQRFEEFREFQKGSGGGDGGGGVTPPPEPRTPEELLEQGYAQHRDSLASELLAKVKNCSPAFFEQLVVDLLVTMGYGGSRKDAGRAVGRSGDGGIDGIIKEDRLGLDAVSCRPNVGKPPLAGPWFRRSRAA